MSIRSPESLMKSMINFLKYGVVAYLNQNLKNSNLQSEKSMCFKAKSKTI